MAQCPAVPHGSSAVAARMAESWSLQAMAQSGFAPATARSGRTEKTSNTPSSAAPSRTIHAVHSFKANFSVSPEADDSTSCHSRQPLFSPAQMRGRRRAAP